MIQKNRKMVDVMSERIDYVLKVREDSREFQLLIETQTRMKVERVVDSLICERKRKGLTQQDIADATGMRAPNITRLETKNTTPTMNVLMRYAEALGMELEINLKNK